VDVFRFATSEIFPVGPKSAGKFLLLVLATLIGCSWLRSDPVSPAPEQSLAEIARATEQIRGLPFKRRVTLSDPPAHSRAIATAQTTAQVSRVYKRIGLLAPSDDLVQSDSQFSKLQHAAFYDPASNAISISPEAVRIGQALAGASTRDAGAVAAVIALTHALQEQHFRWQERVKGMTLEDRKLAFKAVADGDSATVALHFLKSNHSTDLWTDHVQAMGRLSAALEKAASSLPAMLREKLVFPYRDGTQFVQWAYAAKGWAGVNALFADPPLSSAQILHPEQYYLRRGAPVQIIPFGWFRQTKENALTEQTLGEFLIQVLLASSHSRQDAALIASSWTGDYLSAYPDGENLIVAWLSAWNDQAGAQRFYRAFQTVLERRHRLRFEASERQQDGLKADFRTGRSMILQVRGSVVLLLDGMTAARALETSDAIWKELEIRPESPSIPFETAKGPSHSSLTSR
jgi:hypothetical protein